MNDAEMLKQTDQSGLTMSEKIAARFGGLPASKPEETETTTEVSTETDDGLADIDWEGQTLRIPKGLKEAVMRTDDYTRKTQELAEQRRAVEQLREAAQTRQTEAAFHDSVAEENREIAIIDAYLSQASKMDVSSMDMNQLFRHKMELDSVKERRASIVQSITDKRNKYNSELSAKIQELRGKSRELASKSIQGFSEETEKAMREYAKAEGLADTEIDNVLLDPRSYKIIYKAMQFDKVKAGTTQAVQKTEKVLKPGAASERMPADTARKLNFNKAMNAAKTSAQKAQVIEDRLAGVFAKGR